MLIGVDEKTTTQNPGKKLGKKKKNYLKSKD